MAEKRNRNHKGFTLIEMITAFAVLGIVVIGIGAFFVTSSRSYAGTSKESAIQYEAQLALNQIENMLLDSSLGVNYNLILDPNEEVSGFKFVPNDTGVNLTNLRSKVLYVFNIDTNGAQNVLLLKWNYKNGANGGDNGIYYKKLPLNNTYTEVKNIPVQGLDGWELLAEGVEDFSMDLSNYEKTKNVEIKLHLKQRDKEYKTTGTITLRNDVLINNNNITKIYENISKLRPSNIEDVKLSANTLLTVPGGTVQLSTEVIGTYPSQTIHRWQVSKSTDFSNVSNIVFDSDSYEDEDLTNRTLTTIDPAEKWLQVSTANSLDDTMFHGTLHVRAGVKRQDGDYKWSNTLGITVADVQRLGIKPNIKDADEVYSGDSDEIVKQNKAIVKAGNQFQMKYAFYDKADNITEGSVEWGLLPSEALRNKLSITKDGVVTIDAFAPTGGFYVIAYPTTAPETYRASYYFEIASPWTQSDKGKLQLSYVDSLNRGATHQFILTLDGEKQNPLNYNWYATVYSSTGQEIKNGASIDEYGVVTVSETLAFEYNYSLAVNAYMKIDSNMQTGEVITIPRVRLVITDTKPGIIETGTTIEAGRILCSVVGIENYDIQWSMAKSTNANYYFTAAGNSNITGKTHSDGKTKTPVIVIGSDEPDYLEFIRVKAILKDHTNYYTTLTLGFTEAWLPSVPEQGGTTEEEKPTQPETPPTTEEEKPTQPENEYVDPNKGTYRERNFKITGQSNVRRGNTVQLTASYNNSPVTATWKVYYHDGNGYIDMHGKGVSIENGNLKIESDFKLDSLAKNVILRVYAYYTYTNRWGGGKTEYYDYHDVTVLPIEIVMRYSSRENSSGSEISANSVSISKATTTYFICDIEDNIPASAVYYNWNVENSTNKAQIPRNESKTGEKVKFVTSYGRREQTPNNLKISVSVYNSETKQLIETITKQISLY